MSSGIQICKWNNLSWSLEHFSHACVSLSLSLTDSTWTLFLHHSFHLNLPQNKMLHSICDCSIFKKKLRFDFIFIRWSSPSFFCFYCMRIAPHMKCMKFRLFSYFICSVEHWLLDCCKLWRSIAVHAHLYIQSIYFEHDVIVSIRLDKVNNFIGAHQFDFYETAI